MRLSPPVEKALLVLPVVGHLGSLDSHGYPSITPLWWVWDAEGFHMSCKPDRPHVGRLRSDDRAFFVVDVENPQSLDGIRPNWQVKCRGRAVVAVDNGNTWTNRISTKYLRDDDAGDVRRRRSAESRVVVHLRPETLVAVGTHPDLLPPHSATSAPRGGAASLRQVKRLAAAVAPLPLLLGCSVGTD